MSEAGEGERAAAAAASLTRAVSLPPTPLRPALPLSPGNEPPAILRMVALAFSPFTGGGRGRAARRGGGGHLGRACEKKVCWGPSAKKKSGKWGDNGGTEGGAWSVAGSLCLSCARAGHTPTPGGRSPPPSTPRRCAGLPLPLLCQAQIRQVRGDPGAGWPGPPRSARTNKKKQTSALLAPRAQRESPPLLLGPRPPPRAPAGPRPP